jgi:hypothetical protein
MSGWLPIVIATAVGIAATAWTIWVWRWNAERADHRLARWYHHYYRVQGWPYNNAAAVMPVVAGWAWLIAIALLVGALAPGIAEDLTWVAGLIGFALFILTWWVLIRPAYWMQPAWLVEARRREKAGLPSNVPVPPEGDRPVMSPNAFALTIVGYVVFAAAWWYLGLPLQYLLFGLAAGIPILLATRVKK